MSDDGLAEDVKSKKKRKPVPHKWLIAGGAALVALVLLFVFGLVYAGVKMPHQRVILQTFVCGEQTVLDKIDAYINPPADSETGANYTQAVAEIRSHRNYENDPTCAVALAYFYYQMNDATNMETQVSKLKSLSDKGSFPSNKLQLGWNLAEAEENLRIIKD